MLMKDMIIITKLKPIDHKISHYYDVLSILIPGTNDGNECLV